MMQSHQHHLASRYVHRCDDIPDVGSSKNNANGAPASSSPMLTVQNTCIHVHMYTCVYMANIGMDVDVLDQAICTAMPSHHAHSTHTSFPLASTDASRHLIPNSRLLYMCELHGGNHRMHMIMYLLMGPMRGETHLGGKLDNEQGWYVSTHAHHTAPYAYVLVLTLMFCHTLNSRCMISS